jgi:hypothetical protein
MQRAAVHRGSARRSRRYGVGDWGLAGCTEASQQKYGNLIFRVIDILRIDAQSLIGLAWLRGIRVALPHGVADSQDNKQHRGGNEQPAPAPRVSGLAAPDRGHFEFRYWRRRLSCTPEAGTSVRLQPASRPVTSSIRTRDILFQIGMRAALSTSMAADVFLPGMPLSGR